MNKTFKEAIDVVLSLVITGVFMIAFFAITHRIDNYEHAMRYGYKPYANLRNYSSINGSKLRNMMYDNRESKAFFKYVKEDKEYIRVNYTNINPKVTYTLKFDSDLDVYYIDGGE